MQLALAFCALGVMLAGGLPPALAASPAGEVAFVNGIASAYKPGEPQRFLAKGDALNEGDIISTGGRGFAVISLKDGTKMTLRPNTRFAIDKFDQSAGQEAAWFRLLKGGLRAVTGLISKRNSDAVKITSATATIGIRGTAFDARICGEDCAKELRTARETAAPKAEPIVARIAVLSGAASIVRRDGQTRLASRGSPLISGESVRTGKGAFAVLAFRDETRVTVVSDSEFKLENVSFSGSKNQEGSFIARMVKGGMRVLTGFLAKNNPKAVQLQTATATIGIRGTGLDAAFGLECVGATCSPVVFANTWEGSIGLQGGPGDLEIKTGDSGVFNPATNRLALLDSLPPVLKDQTAPRPDTLKIDFDNLFGTSNLEPFRHGLYVGMRDGHIGFAGPGGFIDLGQGEAGLLPAGAEVPIRVTPYPPFMSDDPYPEPENFDERAQRLLEIINPGGGPGDTICEVQ